jgi:ketosteroid isomerase-like protein
VGPYESQLRAMLAAYNERGLDMFSDPDVRAIVEELIDPEIESFTAAGVQGGTYHGIEGMIEMVRDFTSAFSELRTDVVEATETDDSLVASVHYRGRGAASGAPVDEVYIWAQRFRGGKAVNYAIARDREQALRAAGLEDHRD